MTTETLEQIALWKIVNEFVGDCRGELSLDEQLLVCRELRRRLVAELSKQEPVAAWMIPREGVIVEVSADDYPYEKCIANGCIN